MKQIYVECSLSQAPTDVANTYTKKLASGQTRADTRSIIPIPYSPLLVSPSPPPSSPPLPLPPLPPLLISPSPLPLPHSPKTNA